MVVICGCLALFGNGFSTISAQCELPPPYLALAAQATGTAGRRAGRRGRRRGNSSTGQSTNEQEVAASYSRYSSDQQREDSITDQQRKCHEAAERNGHRILPEFEYADGAVSGTKLHRDGLDAMLRGAEAGEFHVLYFHSLSRLARESVITMPMLKRLVYNHRVRIVSVTEGIDSDRDNWEVIASIMSLLHERYIKELAENVFRGQEGTVLAEFAVGDHRFGFKTEPIPGSEATRRGRHAKPRMTYVIDETTAPWVIRIFDWFVKERRSLNWIARELNRRGAPKDHRAWTPDWSHGLVTSLLSCPKYIGIWPWGENKNVRDPETGKIRQEPRPEEECEKWTRHLPYLRIIEQEVFDKAQELLEENYERSAENRSSDGRLKGGASTHPRHLLSGLIRCGQCGSKFHVGGTNSKYMFCPRHHRGTCLCQTQLRRDRAERMILDEIGSRILSNSDWFQAAYDRTVKVWRQAVDRVPAELSCAQQALADLDRRIERLVDRIERGLDDPDVEHRLGDRRSERRKLRKRVEKLQQANEHCGPEPTVEWVQERLRDLSDTLRGDAPAAAYALRDLLGGQIVVAEIRDEGRQRFRLQGCFRLTACAIADAVAGHRTTESCASTGPEDLDEEIVIDFVDPNPLDAESEKAKELYDKDTLNADIARQLGCSRSKVTKLLKHWFESRGLEMPDGRSRRSQLDRKHTEPPMYQLVSDEVKRLSDDGLLFGEIASEIGCDRNTVTKALAFWHESRGKVAPDGRTRRKLLDHKVTGSRCSGGDASPKTVCDV